MKKIAYIILTLIVLYLLLLTPDTKDEIPKADQVTAFAWDQDLRCKLLEKMFYIAYQSNCELIDIQTNGIASPLFLHHVGHAALEQLAGRLEASGRPSIVGSRRAGQSGRHRQARRGGNQALCR